MSPVVQLVPCVAASAISVSMCVYERVNVTSVKVL